MTELDYTGQSGRLLTELSNALVALHKEQFGRGPTRTRTNFAGPDMIVTVFEDALLPAERALVDMGQQQRVREARLFMQVATAGRFIEAIKRITGREVKSFVSASDPDQGLVIETCVFEPLDGDLPAGK